MLGAWARFVHHHRLAVLGASAAVLVAAVAIIAGGAEYTGNNTVSTEASRASALVNRELPRSPPSFTLIAGSATANVSDPAFHQALDAALAPLRSDAHVVSMTTPYAADGRPDPQRVSSDGRHALTTIATRDGSRATYVEVRGRLTSQTLDLVAAGAVVVDQDYNAAINDDASRGERLSIPLSLVLLFVVFGSVLAALLPLGVALFATFGGLASLTLLTKAMDIDSAASNTVLFLGLGLGIDY